MHWISEVVCLMRKTVSAVVLWLLMATAGFAGTPFEIRILGTEKAPVYELHGDIPADANRTFFRTLGDRMGGTLYLDSFGGNLEAAIAIGYEVRRRGITTYVKREAGCLSACAIIWAGGRERYDVSGINLAFHRPWMIENGVRVDADAGQLRYYYVDMGFNSAAIERLLWRSDSLYWLNAEKAKALGIDAHFTD